MGRGTLKTKAATLLILLVAGSLAGCLGTGPKEGKQTLPPLPLVAEDGVYELHDCTEVSLAVRVPAPLVLPLIPDSMQIDGIVNGDAPLLVWGLSCPRGTGNTTNDDNVGIFFANVFASPKNRDWWVPDATSYYVLDFATNADGLIETLGAHGLAVPKGTITMTAQALPDNLRLASWSVATPMFGVSLSNRFHAEDTQTNRHIMALWFGNGPLKVVVRDETAIIDSLTNAGSMAFSGTSKIQKAVGGAPVVGAPGGVSSIATQETWKVSDEVFK